MQDPRCKMAVSVSWILDLGSWILPPGDPARGYIMIDGD